MASFLNILVVVMFLLVASKGEGSSVPIVNGLSYSFYSSSCPRLEAIVRSHLAKVFKNDITQSAGLLRLHFHDCFVQGCDASVLLDGSASGPSEQNAPPNLSLRPEAFQIINRIRALVQRECGRVVSCADLTALAARDSVFLGCDGSVLLDGSASVPSEQNAPPNLTLRPEAFQIINGIRALVQRECGRIVSCADLTALAARDSVYLTGGPYYDIPYGRKDSINFASRNVTVANLPAPTSNTTTLLNALAKKNLDATDVVALSGGHTIGRSHCTSFANRLYPSQDNTIDQTFAKTLKVTCPTATTTNTTNLDLRTPNKFDNKYYVDLMNRQGLFTSDQTLYNDPRTKDIVTSFAIDQNLFFEKFVVAMLKMGQLGVLTGGQGEIRANCSARNSNDFGLWSIVDDDQQEGNLSEI